LVYPKKSITARPRWSAKRKGFPCWSMSPSSGAGWGGSSTKPWNACCDSGLGPQRVQAPQPAKPTRTIRAATSPSRRVVFRVTKVSPRLPQYGSLRNTGQRNKIGMSYRRGTFVSLPPRTHVRAGRWVVASCVVGSLRRWVIASFGRWVAVGLRAAPRREQAPGVRPQQVSRRGVGPGAGTAADGPVRAQAAFAPQAPLILEDREHRRPAVDVQQRPRPHVAGRQPQPPRRVYVARAGDKQHPAAVPQAQAVGCLHAADFRQRHALVPQALENKALPLGTVDGGDGERRVGRQLIQPAHHHPVLPRVDGAPRRGARHGQGELEGPFRRTQLHNEPGQGL